MTQQVKRYTEKHVKSCIRLVISQNGAKHVTVLGTDVTTQTSFLPSHTGDLPVY